MESRRKKIRGPVPERWLYCPPNGNQLITGKFMPLKTPLDFNFDNRIPINLRYHPERIFLLAQRNRVNFGLWIDLTNTKRYYNREDIERHNCKYVKIRCKGHSEAPTEENTQSFISVVENHISTAPFDCIAIHCTHGFNRTGFLITAFLVEKLNFDVTTALLIFSQSRPPGIYKNEYIKELFRRYGKVENAFQAPPLPHWSKDNYS